MSDGTKIECTDVTWNPITGCSVVSLPTLLAEITRLREAVSRGEEALLKARAFAENELETRAFADEIYEHPCADLIGAIDRALLPAAPTGSEQP